MTIQVSELTPRVMERQRSIAEEQNARVHDAQAEVQSGSLLERLQFHLDQQVWLLNNVHMGHGADGCRAIVQVWTCRRLEGCTGAAVTGWLEALPAPAHLPSQRSIHHALLQCSAGAWQPDDGVPGIQGLERDGLSYLQVLLLTSTTLLVCRGLAESPFIKIYTGCRGGCALMGFAGTWAGRFFIDRLGLLNAGALALTLQVRVLMQCAQHKLRQ